MRVFAAPVVSAFSLILLVCGSVLAQDRPIVAVFDIEVQDVTPAAKILEKLDNHLCSSLAEMEKLISGGCKEVQFAESLEKVVAQLAGSGTVQPPAPAPRPAPPVDNVVLTWIKSFPAGIEFTKSEVTVAQYRLCVDAGKCSPPDSKEVHKACNWGYAKRNDHPVNCVSWRQATTFCEWAGGRLPSLEEWRSEATDKDARMYPWGFEPPTCDRAVSSKEESSDGCGKHSTWPVCSKPAGNSVSGLCDMAGNVAEWLSTMPPELEDYRVYIGGSWTDSIPDNRFFLLRITSTIYGQYVKQNNIGFRCVRPTQ